MNTKPNRHHRILSVVLALCLFLSVLPTPGFAASEEDPVTPFAVGATPSTSQNKANFYIYLDGSWTCIGTINFTSSTSFFNRTASISTPNLVSLVNSVVSDDYALSVGDFTLRYSNNTGFTSNTGYATINNNTTTLSGYNSSSTVKAAKYIRFMATNSGGNTHNPLNFYTVTFDYPDQTDVTFIVPTGASVTMPDNYVWTANGNQYDPGASVTITGTTTFVGATAAYTLTFINGGETTTAEVERGETYSLPDLPDKWHWNCDGTEYEPGSIITPTGNMTFTATAPIIYTITLINADQTTTVEVDKGNSYTLPDLPDKWHWNCDGTEYAPGSVITPTGNMTFIATAPPVYTITLINGDETTTTEVEGGDTYTLPDLPDRWHWDCDGTKYEPGTVITPTGNMTFIATAPIIYTITLIDGEQSTTVEVVKGDAYTLPDLGSDYCWIHNGTEYRSGTVITPTGDMTFTVGLRTKATIKVSYSVNFPTGSSGFFGNTFPASPTLIGTNNATSASDTVIEDNNTTLRDLSDRAPVCTGSTHGAQFKLAVRFVGWRTESGATLFPNANLTWSELQNYDADGDGIVELTGQWDYGTGKTANFCVRYDSKTGQSDTSTSRYTPSLFSAYVGGTGSLSLDGQTDEAAYAADQQIRALYGNWSGDLWLFTFPSDEYIFEQLKNHVSNLTVEDKQVNVNDLNSTKYAIRWYVFKKDNTDGWHVDGRLVEKKGQITVYKEFYGDEAAITAAESGFHIVAQNAAGTKQHVLVLDNATAASLSRTYPNATFQTYDPTQSDPSIHSYEWLIEDVALNEVWQITEYPTDVDGYAYYSEHSVYDTDGEVTALAQSGTTATAVGKTFALDEDSEQGLLVDFRNFYYPLDSIFIKKEDANTGLPLNGAGFEFWQRNSSGTLEQLKFIYDSAAEQYIHDAAGTITQVTTGREGYATISTTGFSYALGDIVIKEVTAPSGYDPAPNITLTSTDDIVSISDMSYDHGSPISSGNWSQYARLEENGAVLVIKDHSNAYTNVTVNKVWADSVTEDTVTVELLANGTIATNAFPGMPGVQVVLSAENGWTHTWTNLPVYANGVQVEWGVKEIKIGNETTLSDNTSFANWTVVHSPATKIDADGDGLPEDLYFTITNTIRRTQLFITKTDLTGTTPVAGAEFTLTEVEWVGGTWTAVNGSSTGISDERGLIHFDNLIAGAFYQLTETAAPYGYSVGQETIVLTLDSSGQIMEVTSGVASASTLGSEYHKYTAPYNLTIMNIPQYSCAIYAPDELTFTFTSTEVTIWNPERSIYETVIHSRWSENSPIFVYNLSVVDVYLTVEAIFTYASGFPSGSDLTLSLYTLENGFTATNGNNNTSISGTLFSNNSCGIILEVSGTPPSTLTETPVQVGTLTINVRPPQRRRSSAAQSTHDNSARQR